LAKTAATEFDPAKVTLQTLLFGGKAGSQVVASLLRIA